MYLGLEILPWLTTDWVLSMFSQEENVGRSKYSQFVSEGLAEIRRQELHSGNCAGRMLGTEDFVDAALRKAHQREHRPVTYEEISAEA